MSQCLRITVFIESSKKKLPTIIQKKARDLSIEGTVQAGENSTFLIIVCGNKEKVDEFVDMLHQEIAQKTIQDITIEPFVKTKDYRGVFRIIE